MEKLTIKRDEKGRCDKYAWPGGYPIYYLCADGGVLCPDCVDAEQALIDAADEHDKQWFVIAQEINYEDAKLYCDNCNKRIAPAYAD
jgi:hypothetical protein